MNYLEMKQLDKNLSNFHAYHQFITFNSTHKWPPHQVLEQALHVLQLFNMQRNLDHRNDSLISCFLTDNSTQIRGLLSANNTDSLIIAYNSLRNVIQACQGLTNLSSLETEKKELEKNEALKDYINRSNTIELTESKKQQEFSKSYTTQSNDWWTKEINKLKSDSKIAKDALERQSCRRLLAFISLMSYSYVNSAIAQQNWDAASHFLLIYGIYITYGINMTLFVTINF